MGVRDGYVEGIQHHRKEAVAANEKRQLADAVPSKQLQRARVCRCRQDVTARQHLRDVVSDGFLVAEPRGRPPAASVAIWAADSPTSAAVISWA